MGSPSFLNRPITDTSCRTNVKKCKYPELHTHFEDLAGNTNASQLTENSFTALGSQTWLPAFPTGYKTHHSEESPTQDVVERRGEVPSNLFYCSKTSKR